MLLRNSFDGTEAAAPAPCRTPKTCLLTSDDINLDALMQARQAKAVAPDTGNLPAMTLKWGLTPVEVGSLLEGVGRLQQVSLAKPGPHELQADGQAPG
jgi:hypothetical protein